MGAQLRDRRTTVLAETPSTVSSRQPLHHGLQQGVRHGVAHPADLCRHAHPHQGLLQRGHEHHGLRLLPARRRRHFPVAFRLPGNQVPIRWTEPASVMHACVLAASYQLTMNDRVAHLVFYVCRKGQAPPLNLKLALKIFAHAFYGYVNSCSNMSFN